jgi:hypothetical protein
MYTMVGWCPALKLTLCRGNQHRYMGSYVPFWMDLQDSILDRVTVLASRALEVDVHSSLSIVPYCLPAYHVGDGTTSRYFLQLAPEIMMSFTS